MNQRVYLDTSVLSALGDARSPDRQSLTREFFDRLKDFDASSSELTRTEIERTPDAKRRSEMLSLLATLQLFPISDEARELAEKYMRHSIFPPTVPEDALHVAIAVLARQDVLASWNFKHLVNQKRRAAIVAVNASLGLPTPAILAPPEV